MALSRRAIRRIVATSDRGAAGKLGRRRVGAAGGVRWESVVIRVAVQVPGLVLVPAVGGQVAGEPSAVVPFINCTVPVGPGALLVPVTLAVSVTLPPDMMEVELDEAVVVVACLPAVTVTVMAEEAEAE